MSRWERKRKYDITKMADDEFHDFMDFCEDSDEEVGGDDFDSDDNVDDPDYVLPNESDFFPQEAVSCSINVSDLDLSLATSAPPPSEIGNISESANSFTVETATFEASAGKQNNAAEEISIPFASRLRKKARMASVDDLQGEPEQSSLGHFQGNIAQLRNNMAELQKLIWRKKNIQIHVRELAFQNPDKNEFSNLKTPYDCFAYFVDEDLLELISSESNLYARQKKINSTFFCKSQDIRKYIGILMFMSVYRYPNVRSFWGRHSFELIRNAMTVNRFEEIRSHIHFADSSKRPSRDDAEYDILYLIRPVIKHMNTRFSSVPMVQRLSIDEQMCGTKMSKTNIKQYMPNKPHKWGFKIFSICDTKGYSYNFEVFTGAADNVIQEETPDLGAASNVVVRLSRNIPDFRNHITYFDNYFTSLGLLVYLRSRGIYSLGTFRANRVKNCKLSTDEQLVAKKVPRGYSEEYVATAFGIDISTVVWKDNKGVRLASTYAGVQPFHSNTPGDFTTKSRRWNRTTKQYEEVSCPNIVKEYNRHMGGVDLMDSLIGRYKIRMKTGKWPSRLFHHMLDLAMVNAYVLYHRINSEKHQRIELPKFREEVAESLLLMSEKKKVGRPSNDAEHSAKTPQKSKMYLPPSNVRYDGLHHWPSFQDKSKKRQCRNKPCKSDTQVYCEKCGIPLCMSIKKSCFKDFHTL